ncbi:FAD-binding oxidoreductase [Parvularcula marina]|uniref:FAD-binding oxidoreductase n=1 Tax=Parvularcula marina TaxID=2292771 RepID=A0A371REH4_9PROT|nr:FAD-binding oxidoreductase [Parvularcula marina]RFB03854.1 FAD-binding oxidoreductase [Parvularcula marina]
MTDHSSDALTALTSLAGPDALIEGDDRTPLLEEWRGRWPGEASLVLAPGSTEELSSIMRYCHAHDLAVVPQGGNTGLVGGQVPQGEVLISTRRINRIRDISPEDFTLTAEAGVTLEAVQDAAREAGRLFPLSIGSEGSCNIGGVLSTNAGGVNVIRYGNARDLVLGIEAVLPDGRIWNGLNRLRKNNTGYDLKHLFIGGEGTLGIITAAVLKLYPRPAETQTAFLAVPSPAAAVDLLSLVQEKSGGAVTSFELMNANLLELVLAHFPDLPRPVETRSPFYVLTELSAGRQGVLAELTEDILSGAMERKIVSDGTIAQSEGQAYTLWALRHNASEAMKKDAAQCVKCDISVPIREVPSFLEKAGNAVTAEAPGARIIAFGHMGDGNIHYDILAPDGASPFGVKKGARLEHLVHEVVVAHDGSISAEHGIGLLKRDELKTRKSDVEMEMMRAIKTVLDSKGLMNPGKLL